MKDQKPKNAMNPQNQAMLKAFKAIGNVLSPCEGLQEYKDLCVMRALRDRVANGHEDIPLDILIKRAESAAAATYWSRRYWSRQKRAA